MSATEQFDLFSASPGPTEADPRGAPIRPAVDPAAVSDDKLVAALAGAPMRDCIALAAEAGRRRLMAAIPALDALCRRFAGFGVNRVVPEQAAALDALAAIGGPGARQALARLIASSVVQGPGLRIALAAAARVNANIPAPALLRLVRNGDPQIRADACRCARSSPEAVSMLRDLLDDLDSNVRTAAACALGRMGQSEIRPLLVRFLRQEPSAEIIDAVAAVADDETIILLGRVARATPQLAVAALDALDAIDQPRAAKVAAGIREMLARQ
jgi:HEAT repeats